MLRMFSSFQLLAGNPDHILIAIGRTNSQILIAVKITMRTA
jgi:hypothetical protein